MLKPSNTDCEPAPYVRRSAPLPLYRDLTELVSVPVLHQAQDAFTLALKVPVLFLNADGEPITQSESLESFCWRLSRQGEAKGPCANCGRLEHVLSEGCDKPFACPLGFTDFLVPIKAGELTVGYIASSLVAEAGAPLTKGANGITAAASEYAEQIPQVEPERIGEIKDTVKTLAKVISELALTSRENKLSAINDPVTGLANRVRFWDKVNQELDNADRLNYPVTIMLIDLDDLKNINITYGRDTGDKVLWSVGQVLKRELRGSDLAARHGSDAFIALLPCADPEGAQVVGWRLKTRIAACKIAAGGKKISISASIGYVTYPDCAVRDPDDIFKAAAEALIRAKTEAAVNKRVA